jgi:hypothetical protein
MDGQASCKSLGQYNQFTGRNGNKNRNNKSYNLAARVLGANQNKACQAKCIDLFGSKTFWQDG